MKQNDSLKSIAKILEDAQSLLLLSHRIADGDTIGSCAALADTLSRMGKQVHVCTGEKLPATLRFLQQKCFCTQEALLSGYDVVAALDCSDPGRLHEREKLLGKGKHIVNIDHHKTNTYYGDINYVDGGSAATGEIIFALMKEAGWPVSKVAAEGLYTAIVTDTGQFQYSNTTENTHRIAAELIEAGINRDEISISLYQSDSREKLLAIRQCLMHLEFFHGDRVAFSSLSQKEIEEIGAEIWDTDGMVELLRNVETVEVAVFVKEIEKGIQKVGMRSKRFIDVAEIAAVFGGGGHVRAAGYSASESLQVLKERLVGEIISRFDMEERV